MKKRIFSRVLALVMALSLLNTTAFAMACLNDQDDNGGYKYIDSTSGALKGHTTEDGSTSYDYYLNDDLTLQKTLVVNNGNASIDLNGYKLQLNDQSTIQTETNGCTVDVLVKDSSGTVKTGSVIQVYGKDTELTVRDEGVEGVQKGTGIGTITGGNSKKSGGGVYVTSGSSFTLESGSISGNKATYGGGVLSQVGTSFTMTGGSITQNVSNAQGGGINAQGTLTITDGTISYNKALANNGGGIFMEKNATAEISNATVVWNETAINGGGINATNAGTVTIKDCVVEHNTAGYTGGGVFLYDNREGTSVNYSLENVTVQDNTAKKYTGGVAVEVQETDTVSLANNLIFGNKSEDAENDSENAVGGIKSNHELNLENNTICGNTVLSQPNQIKNGDSPVATDGQHRETDWSEWKVTTAATPDENGVETRTCKHCGTKETRELVYVPGNTGSTGDTTIPGADIPLGDLPTGGADAATTTIEDEETPLAGLFTRADAIGYLWEQTGSPEAELSDFADVPEDHYWAVAIGWAQDMGIALPDEDGNFRPDDLVLRTSDEPEGELQEFLNRYAAFAGVELEDGELFIELDGAAEDFIMGEEAQVIFDEFFAKLEAALAAQAA